MTTQKDITDAFGRLRELVAVAQDKNDESTPTERAAANAMFTIAEQLVTDTHRIADALEGIYAVQYATAQANGVKLVP